MNKEIEKRENTSLDKEVSLYITLKIFLQKPQKIRIGYGECSDHLSINEIENFLAQQIPEYLIYNKLNVGFYKQFCYRKDNKSPLIFIEKEDKKKNLIYGGHLIIQILPMGSSRGGKILKTGISAGTTGATIGGAIGSVVPGIGTAIGAAIGGALGFIGGAIYATWQTGVEQQQRDISELARQRLAQERELTKLQPNKITIFKKQQSKELAKVLSDNRIDGGSVVPEMFGQMRLKGRALTKLYLSRVSKPFITARYTYAILYSFGEGPLEFSAHRFKTFHGRALVKTLRYYRSLEPRFTEYVGSNENEMIEVPGQNSNLENYLSSQTFPAQDRAGLSISLIFDSGEEKSGQSRLSFSAVIEPRDETFEFNKDSIFTRDKDLWFLGWFDHNKDAEGNTIQYNTRQAAVDAAVAAGHAEPFGQSYQLSNNRYVACWPRLNSSLPCFIIAMEYVNNDAEPNDLPPNVSVSGGFSSSAFRRYQAVFLNAQQLESATNFSQIFMPVISQPFVNLVKQIRVYRINVSELFSVTSGSITYSSYSAHSFSGFTGVAIVKSNSVGIAYGIPSKYRSGSRIEKVLAVLVCQKLGQTALNALDMNRRVWYKTTSLGNQSNFVAYSGCGLTTESQSAAAQANRITDLIFWLNGVVRHFQYDNDSGEYNDISATSTAIPDSLRDPSTAGNYSVNLDALEPLNTAFFNTEISGEDFFLTTQPDAVVSPNRQGVVSIQKSFWVDDPPPLPDYPDVPESPASPESPPSFDYVNVAPDGSRPRYIYSNFYLNKLRTHQNLVAAYNRRVSRLESRYKTALAQWSKEKEPFNEVFNKFVGGANDFSVFVKRKIKDFLAEDPNLRVGFNFEDNPAKIFVSILKQFIDKQRLNVSLDDIIETTDFREWRDFCNDRELKFNGIFDFESTVSDVLRTLAFVGMAEIDFSFGKMRPIIKKPRTMTMQYFHTRNISELQYIRTGVSVPDVIIAEFINEAKNYQLDQVKSFTGDNTEATAIEEERMSLLGVTNEAQALKYLRLQRKQYQMINESWTFKTDLMGVVAQRGDLVALNHFEINNAQFSCRIRNLITDENGMIEGIQIDQENIPENIFPDQRYAVKILCSNNTEIELEVARFEDRAVSSDFDNLAESDQTLIRTRQSGKQTIGARPKKWKSIIFRQRQDPDVFCGTKDDYVIFGQMNEIFRECLVSSISVGKDFSVGITLIPYDPELYT